MSYVNHNTMKKLVQDAVLDILSEKRGVAYSYAELYKASFELCNQGQGRQLHKLVQDAIAEYMNKYAANVEESDREGNLLGVLLKFWTSFTTALLMVDDVLFYLYGHLKVERVSVIGLTLFREGIFKTHDVGKRGRNYVLELVEAERRGENIEGQYIVSFCHMLGKMAAYKEEFEDHFLSHTAIFYSAEGDNLFRENTIGGYLRKVDEIFNKEAERVKRYDNNTMVELKKVLTEELLTQEEKTRRNPRLHSRLDAILNGDSGMVFMIENLRFEELRLMFKLLKDADGALHKIAAILNDYFEQTGTSIVSTMTSLPVDSNLPKEQILFIEKLLELKAQVDRVVSEAFSSVAEFVDLANIGFRKLVNLSEKTAECFSVYVNDRFLHKFTKMQVNEIEDAINGFVRFYEFIGAKDIFENWFKRHLARRLLGSKGVVKENEEMFISKLRNHCAFMYTKELADMFTDVEISATLTETFQADQNNMDEAERNPIGLEMKIIRSGLWPLSAPPPINLPKVLSESLSVYESFYKKYKHGRKLTLAPEYSYAHLKAEFKGQEKTLVVSTFQAMVLLKFNEKDKFTFQELLDATNIAEPALKRCMATLALGKPSFQVLLRKSKTARNTIESEDEFTVNDNFKSKTREVKLMGVKVNVNDATTIRPEIEEARKRDVGSRKTEVDAAIVRIMKTRKTLPHSQLIVETIVILKARFTPQVSMLKERIDSLIDREYLERDERDRTVYKYCA